MMIRVSEQQHGEQGLEELYEILRGYPGNCELQLVVCLADGSRVFMKSDQRAGRTERRDAVPGRCPAGPGQRAADRGPAHAVASRHAAGTRPRRAYGPDVTGRCPAPKPFSGEFLAVFRRNIGRCSRRGRGILVALPSLPN